MHLRADGPLIAYFQSLSRHIDTADLDQLEPYGAEGDRSWPPEEALAQAERLQALYIALRGKPGDRDVGGLWPIGPLGEYEPSEDAGGREGVSDFLFWLRRTFLEAAQRNMYVLGLAD